MLSASRAGETQSSLLESNDFATSAVEPFGSLPAVLRLCVLFSRSFCFSRVLLIFSFMFAVLLDIAPLLRWRSFRGRRQLPQAGEVRRPLAGEAI